MIETLLVISAAFFIAFMPMMIIHTLRMKNESR